MSEPFFFSLSSAPTVGDLALIVDAQFDARFAARRIEGLAALERAGSHDLAYYDNPRYAQALAATRAGACLVRPALVGRVPENVAALVVDEPYRAFARLAARLVPDSLRAAPIFAQGVAAQAHVHPQARLEPGVDVAPGAVIGSGAEIGAGTQVGANVVIGADVRIGRDCAIGAGSTLSCALLGDRVILHAGVRIGQDGFGFALGRSGHLKVPQLGRVIVQDDVEIGAGSALDRGATRDTIVGEGTKIDNLVQIGHNVVVGRHCVIVAQVGIAGSTELGDFVMVGGQSGVAGHLHIGAGARIAAQSGVMRDVAPGASVGGTPARDLRLFLKGAARERRAGAHKDANKTRK
ncbi:MAG: UDP-3-O-(3-hydroxymyristoyl)glucosamine N-acyltransferase [Rhodoblastus sp.]